MKGSINLIPASKRKIVESLIRKNVSDLKFGESYISFNYDNTHIRNAIKISQHVPMVAHWLRGKNVVVADNDMEKYRKELNLLAFHESVEKYVCQKYGLSSNLEGHYVANAIERRLAQKLGVNWNNYTWRTEFLFRKESANRIDKRSKTA